MLCNSVKIESNLNELGVPVVLKQHGKIPTHHIWITFDNKDKAFEFFKKMEQCRFLVNYRKLPYNLGYGIRMGTSAATLQGINENNQRDLSLLIFKIYNSKRISKQTISDCQDFINSLVPLSSI